MPLSNEEEDSTVVLFNRRLLQNPSLTNIPNYSIEPDLIDSNTIPTLEEIEESFIHILENSSTEDQKALENIEIMNQLKSIIQVKRYYKEQEDRD